MATKKKSRDDKVLFQPELVQERQHVNTKYIRIKDCIKFSVLTAACVGL